LTASSADLADDTGYSTEVRSADGEVDGKAEKCSGCSGEATDQRRRGKARQVMVIEL